MRLFSNFTGTVKNHFYTKKKQVELFYLNSTLNFGIPIVFVFQLEVYYMADRLLIGLSAQ